MLPPGVAASTAPFRKSLHVVGTGLSPPAALITAPCAAPFARCFAYFEIAVLRGVNRGRSPAFQTNLTVLAPSATSVASKYRSAVATPIASSHFANALSATYIGGVGSK